MLCLERSTISRKTAGMVRKIIEYNKATKEDIFPVKVSEDYRGVTTEMNSTEVAAEAEAHKYGYLEVCVEEDISILKRTMQHESERWMGATCVVQPLDLIKTRMQLGGRGRSSFAVASEIVAREGVIALYTGLSAGLLRQATYTTTRLGVFNYLFDLYKVKYEGQAPGFGAKTALGVIAGGVGAYVGTPAEVALIRMTADGRLPADQRRNYKNVADALMRIIKEEGVLKLWRGATPTVTRAMVVNAAQLGTYSQVRSIHFHTICCEDRHDHFDVISEGHTLVDSLTVGDLAVLLHALVEGSEAARNAFPVTSPWRF
ncbi:hypothetical protein EVAR_28906_1 [Eumeta japonica]|uniref:Mitochondrial 2-oxoglutarate/malate carrier protein n=1 Tax=Eumeta variegata TaxID=151549 RepID=A0A4C1WXP8_EUMVA|nr:hypothetical protein EVAR_28906_1 [Eumeta japonica]